MDQDAINAAFESLVAGNEKPWRDVVAGLRDGSIEWSTSAGSLTIRTGVSEPMRNLSQYLQALRRKSGLTQAQLAEEIGSSLSSIIRTLQGRVLPAYSAVRLMVEVMDGDVATVRRLYEAAKQDRRSLGGPGRRSRWRN